MLTLEPVDDSHGECFRICEFVIDIGLISVKNLIAMRAVLPSPEYKLLKNRKCARESRKKRKQQIAEDRELLQICQAENEQLRRKVAEYEARIRELESRADCKPLYTKNAHFVVTRCDNAAYFTQADLGKTPLYAVKRV